MNRIQIAMVSRPFCWREPKTYMPQLIKKFSGVKWHHALLFIEKEKEIWTLESIIRGTVPVMTEKEFVQKAKEREYDIVIYELYLTPYKSKCYQDNLKELIGKPYDYSSLLFYFAIYYITKRVFNKGIWLGKRGEKAKGKILCTELVSTALDFFFPTYWKIGPLELYEWLQNEAKEVLRIEKGIKEVDNGYTK